MRLSLGLSFALLPAVAFACPEGEAAIKMQSDQALGLEAVLNLADPPLSQPFELEVQFCGDLTPDRIDVDAIMPAHQHGMNYVPNIEKLDAGVFAVEGMLFHMPGVWQVQVAAHSGDDVARFTYDLELK